MTELERFRMQKDAFFRSHPQSPLRPEQQPDPAPDDSRLLPVSLDAAAVLRGVTSTYPAALIACTI